MSRLTGITRWAISAAVSPSIMNFFLWMCDWQRSSSFDYTHMLHGLFLFHHWMAGNLRVKPSAITAIKTNSESACWLSQLYFVVLLSFLKCITCSLPKHVIHKKKKNLVALQLSSWRKSWAQVQKPSDPSFMSFKMNSIALCLCTPDNNIFLQIYFRIRYYSRLKRTSGGL